MEKKQFEIPNITSAESILTIKEKLGELEGIEVVEGNPYEKTVTVVYDDPSILSEIEKKLKDINFPPE